MMKHTVAVVVLLVAGLGGCQPDASRPAETSGNTASSEVNSKPEGSRSNASKSSPLASGSQLGIFLANKPGFTGKEFVYSNDEGHSGFSIVESMGGGLAVVDWDRDGNLDFICSGGGKFENRTLSGNPSGIFRNQGSWRFQDVSTLSGGAASPKYSHGIAAADFDEDGFDDFLVTGYGGVTLYHNQGDGCFVDVTASSGLSDPLWSTSAAWGDLNGDGSLDLYIAHYVNWSFDNDPACAGVPPHPREVCPPRRYEPLPDTVYFGNGDGSFSDATQIAGLRSDGKGIGVVIGDIDLDSDLDIYVANDTVANFLYRNDGQGRFEDISLESGTSVSDRGLPEGSMGTDMSDLTLDGKPDIWVANYERESCGLYRNLGMGLFRHVSQSSGITAVGAVYVGWGTRAIDFDLDGDEDLFVSNGHVLRFPADSPRKQVPLVFENLDGRRFVNVADSAGSYTSATHCGRGIATGDLDGDGDEDIVLSNMNEPVEVLSSEPKTGNNWLVVRVVGLASCRNGIGTSAVATIGSRKILRQIRGGGSYASSSDMRLYFGCGKNTELDEIEITFPSKRSVKLSKVRCNRTLLIHEPVDHEPLGKSAD